MYKFLAVVSAVAFAQTSVDCVAYYTLNQASLVDPSQIKYCVTQCTEMPTAGTCPEGFSVTDCVQSLDACKFIEGGQDGESAPTEAGEIGEGGDQEEAVVTEGENAEGENPDGEGAPGSDGEEAGGDASAPPRASGASLRILFGSAVVLALMM